MKSVLKSGIALSALLVSACGQQPNEAQHSQSAGADTTVTKTMAVKPELGTFGVDLTAGDASIAPGADFFSYANGTWLKEFEIPADRDNYGAFTVLHERSEERVKAIIEEVAATNAEKDSVEQLVGDYYASWMDAVSANDKGIAPLQPYLNKIASIDSYEALAYQLGRASWEQGASPIGGGVSIDRLNPDRYQYILVASGLGLPERDYYLEDTDKFLDVRAKYEAHIAQMLGFTGLSADDAVAAAKTIVALETKIAEHHWPRADLRDSDKTLNPAALAEFVSEYSGFDWGAYFKGVGAELVDLNVNHPSAIKGIMGLIAETDLETWKLYLTYHSLRGNAFLLSEEIDTAHFDFFGKVLGGRPQQRDRWKRGVSLVGSLESLGEALGQVYVKRYFPDEAKSQMQELVTNLGKALGERINGLDWMGDETKAKALEKLGTFNPKIGFPDKWRSYDGLSIEKNDLFGNHQRVTAFFQQFDLDRLGGKTDRDEWFMTPQEVNAYYNPAFNEIVFPAAILQAPFFDPAADPAVNYGGIGAVIGHEMGHGFDDQGSKYDAEGVQRNWWTDEDRANFEAQATALVEQYNAYEALPESFVDGRFTLGENIGDVGGLSMAYHAYKLSLGGKEAPVIDGMTGDQRFFLAWAQVWKRKYRDENLLARLKTDPHSPAKYRVNGVVRNMDAWYDAFDVKEGDPMYLAPEKRVTIW